VGFGTFDSKERAAREGRNPRTGDKMHIAGEPLPLHCSSSTCQPQLPLISRPYHVATVTPTFSFGKSFKDTCKKAYAESARASLLNGHTSPN
jgi:nucleoid DNA-binding protein